MADTEMIQIIHTIRDFLELLLLVFIWRDGKGMLRSSLNMETMYEKWFKERQEEREARKESARKARETKAAKTIDMPKE